MKKKFEFINYINKSKYKKLIYIGLIILALSILILLLVFLFKNNDDYIYEQMDKNNSNIVVKNTYKEKPGTFIRTLPSLKSEHCIKDICIKNVVIYYIKEEGRIDYEIINKGKKKVTGALKLVFDNNKSTYVVYNKLKKDETRKGSISFSELDLSNVDDYSLKNVKESELKKLFNSKK